MRRGELQPPAALRPEPRLESPPLYDVELHAQIKAGIARLCGPPAPSMPGTNNNGELCRHRVPPILAAESAAIERDLAFLAQMQARKAVLQAQEML